MESKKKIFGKVMMNAKPELFSKEYMKLVKAFPVAANKMPAKVARKLLQAIQRRRR